MKITPLFVLGTGVLLHCDAYIFCYFGGRDKVEQDEYQERMVLQLEEQEEEEDLNRIKEESRRRRQAILEKYKCQQLNQRHEPQSEDKGEFL